jgi:hypothetical protein
VPDDEWPQPDKNNEANKMIGRNIEQALLEKELERAGFEPAKA